MTLGKDKVGYRIKYGVAPHFQKLLRESLITTDEYVILFDESLAEHMTKKNKKKQMDVHILLVDLVLVVVAFFNFKLYNLNENDLN